MTQRQEVRRCCWKNCTDRLAQRRVATNLQFVKKMQYLQSGSALNRGKSVERRSERLYKMEDFYGQKEGGARRY